MISYSGSIQQVTLPTGFVEGPWFYKRNNLYYMVYAGSPLPENIRYATSSSPTGPWNYKGVIMDAQGASFTNHPGIVDYNGTSYFFYHNGALPGGGGYARSVCVEKFTYGSDGSIPKMSMSTAGPPMIGTVDPYVRQEAELIAWSTGLKTEACSDTGGGINVAYVNNGDYIKVKGVAFGSGAKSLSVRVASANSGGNIEVRLGSKAGTLVGTCKVPGTGGWQTWTTVTCSISGATGTQDLFWVFTGSGSSELFNFNWWQFDSGGSATPSSSSPPPSSSSSVSSSFSSIIIETLTTTSGTTIWDFTSTRSASATSSSTPPASSTSTTQCSSLYGQCGGATWTGPKCCSGGSTCKYSNDWYSQCL
jgi:arabinoxylan arabinofuranohydrolase